MKYLIVRHHRANHLAPHHRTPHRLATLATVVLLGGCGMSNSDGGGGTGGTGPAAGPIIASAEIQVAERRRIPKSGDLWPSTWADNGNAYFGWGDGTGLGACYPAAVGASDQCLSLTGCAPAPSEVVFCDDFCGAYPCDGSTCYPPCTVTTMGIFEQQGPIADFTDCQTECNKALHVPTGDPQYLVGTDPAARRGDKPTSLLAIGDTLVLAGHQHTPTEVLRGYLAVSDDHGVSWYEVPDSPWVGTSAFRRMMFINMGKGYALNTDGMVYGIGIGELQDGLGQLYLARVPLESVADYAAYRYYAGPGGGGAPRFVEAEADAVPLGPQASFQGGAAYQAGIGRYLLLIPTQGYVVALYEAPEPWGPWTEAQRFANEAYAPAIISKDAGADWFYFTAAGGSGVGDTYQLNVNRMVLTLRQ